MMTLWEAMRLGAMTGRQLIGNYFDGNGGSCAIGSIVIAIGGRAEAGLTSEELFVLWDEAGWPKDAAVLCPACQKSVVDFLFMTAALKELHKKDASAIPNPLACVIVHLNDDHRWTREQIANWLERTYGQPAEEQEPVCVTSTAR
jgi:hypothetical protein